MQRAAATYPTSASRRRFFAGAAALTTASFLDLPRAAAAGSSLEVKKIRLVHAPSICLAPQYLAEELLRLEGFSEIEYVQLPMNTPLNPLQAGQADMTMGAAPDIIAALDAGRGVLPLAGIHAGCYELFVHGRIATVKELRGRSVVVTGGDQSTERLFLSSIVAYIGVNPREINWMNVSSGALAMQTFVDGKADAYLAFAPEPQELRAKKIGRVILNTAQDRPWSQYFCCMLTARREFAERYPVATRRALRAYLKAVDICAQEPERAARFLAAKGYAPKYERALQVLTELPFRKWRDSNPEDTLRFHALRLHEVGIIKSSPQKLIAQGTDWRFLDTVKKELKA